jgi:hypothetical protein
MKKALVALALLLTITTIATTIASASLRGRVRRQNRIHRVMCYTSCPFYRDRCRNVFVKGCLVKRCVKEMVYSCLGNPADAQCARPCSELNPCTGGQQCAQGQCIIQETPGTKCQQLPKLERPKPPTTEACGTIFCPDGMPYCDQGTSTCVAGPPTTTTTLPFAGCSDAYPVECQQQGFCCPSGSTCNAGGCCSADYPVACGGYCCTSGSVCGQGNCTSPCPDDRPVACGDPLVCCAAGSVCGLDCNVTTSTTIPGGGDCNCYCPDGSDCTGGKSCGVDELGIPEPCGCPVDCH